MNKKVLIVLLIVVLLGVAGFFLLNSNKQKEIVEAPQVPAPSVVSNELENGNYVFKKEESQIMWTGKKTLVKDWIDEGFININNGFLNIENGGISSGGVEVDMNSITAQKTGSGSGQERLANHLKSDDFFGVTQFPTSSFEILSVNKTEEKTYTITGNITIKGKTETIEFPANIYMGDGKVFVEAEIIIDRSKFDVRFGSQSFFNDLGNNVIDDNFTLKMKLVGAK